VTDQGAEAPVSPVLGAPRRSRDRTRILLVAAIAILVVGVGIGLAGNGSIDPPAASPTPHPTAVATATGGSLPPLAEATRVPPTQNVGLGCAPVRLGAPPEIRISSDAGNVAPIGGVATTAAPDPSTPPSAWPIPGEDGAARLVGSAGLIVAPDGDACVRYVIAEYRPADPTLKGPFPIAFRTLNVSPPRSSVPLGPLPTGDWVVRIVAYFSTGIAGQESANVAERFFRVLAGRGAGPLPTPLIPPAVPCAPLPASAAPPDLVLAGTTDGEILGIAPGTGSPTVVQATIGDPVEIRDVGDACARSWSIQAQNIDTGTTIDIETQENPTSDPFQFAQNRWRLLSLRSGLLQLTATMAFSADVTVSRRWSLQVSAPDFPATLFRAADGSSVPGAQGCGASWAFPSGSGGARSCTDVAIREVVQELTVPTGSPVRLEAGNGWTLVSWTGACGSITGSSGPVDPFVVIDGCDLGGSLAPGPAVFLPRPGAPAVRLYVTLQRGGVIASDYVYVQVRTNP